MSKLDRLSSSYDLLLTLTAKVADCPVINFAYILRKSNVLPQMKELPNELIVETTKHLTYAARLDVIKLYIMEKTDIAVTQLYQMSDCLDAKLALKRTPFDSFKIDEYLFRIDGLARLSQIIREKKSISYYPYRLVDLGPFNTTKVLIALMQLRPFILTEIYDLHSIKDVNLGKAVAKYAPWEVSYLNPELLRQPDMIELFAKSDAVRPYRESMEIWMWKYYDRYENDAKFMTLTEILDEPQISPNYPILNPIDVRRWILEAVRGSYLEYANCTPEQWLDAEIKAAAIKADGRAVIWVQSMHPPYPYVRTPLYYSELNSQRYDDIMTAIDSEKHWCEAFFALSIGCLNDSYLRESMIGAPYEENCLKAEIQKKLYNQLCGPTAWGRVMREMKRVFSKRGVGETSPQRFLANLVDLYTVD